MAPAVTEARQLRLSAARVILDVDLGDRQMLLGCADHHLGGELHAGRAQVERVEHIATQRAHATVGVAHAGAEEEVEQARQDRVADVAVVPGHRAGFDVLHPVAHHQLRSAVELADEVGDLIEVVGQVGVRHDDVVAASRGKPGQICAAVAAAALDDHARACAGGELGAAVLGVVVDDDHLAVQTARGQCPQAARTQLSMFSSSLRQGSPRRPAGRPPRSPRRVSARVCSRVGPHSRTRRARPSCAKYRTTESR